MPFSAHKKRSFLLRISSVNHSDQIRRKLQIWSHLITEEIFNGKLHCGAVFLELWAGVFGDDCFLMYSFC